MILNAPQANEYRMNRNRAANARGDINISVNLGNGGEPIFLDNDRSLDNLGQKLAANLLPHIQREIDRSVGVLDPYGVRS
jgi:hypothetical protein